MNFLLKTFFCSAVFVLPVFYTITKGQTQSQKNTQVAQGLDPNNLYPHFCAKFNNNTGWSTAHKNDCPLDTTNNPISIQSLKALKSNLQSFNLQFQTIVPTSLLEYEAQIRIEGHIVPHPLFTCLKLGQRHYFSCSAEIYYGEIVAENCRIGVSEECRLQQKTKTCPSGFCPLIHSAFPEQKKECSDEAKARGGLFNFSIILGLDSETKESPYKVIKVFLNTADSSCMQG